MSTSGKLRKLAKEARKQANKEKRVKSAQVMNSMVALKMLERKLNDTET